MPEKTATLRKARRQSRSAAAKSGCITPAAKIIGFLVAAWSSVHGARMTPEVRASRHLDGRAAPNQGKAASGYEACD
jgi:hypothetical protein